MIQCQQRGNAFRPNRGWQRCGQSVGTGGGRYGGCGSRGSCDGRGCATGLGRYWCGRGGECVCGSGDGACGRDLNRFCGCHGSWPTPYQPEQNEYKQVREHTFIHLSPPFNRDTAIEKQTRVPRPRDHSHLSRCHFINPQLQYYSPGSSSKIPNSLPA